MQRPYFFCHTYHTRDQVVHGGWPLMAFTDHGCAVALGTLLFAAFVTIYVAALRSEDVEPQPTKRGHRCSVTTACMLAGGMKKPVSHRAKLLRTTQLVVICVFAATLVWA